jgi:hypothetical protein
VVSSLSCIVSSHYLAKIHEHTEEFMCAVAIEHRLVRLLQLLVVTSYNHPITPVITPNSVSGHQHIII